MFDVEPQVGSPQEARSDISLNLTTSSHQTRPNASAREAHGDFFENAMGELERVSKLGYSLERGWRIANLDLT